MFQILSHKCRKISSVFKIFFNINFNGSERLNTIDVICRQIRLTLKLALTLIDNILQYIYQPLTKLNMKDQNVTLVNKYRDWSNFSQLAEKDIDLPVPSYCCMEQHAFYQKTSEESIPLLRIFHSPRTSSCSG